MSCACKEIVEGGNICHSNDHCDYQMFGTFDDPVFCMDDELKDLEKKGADARREIKAAVDEDLPWLMGNP